MLDESAAVLLIEVDENLGVRSGREAVAAPLEQALRGVVVVRGTEAMAVRDPLPLHLPQEIAEQAAASAERAQDAEPEPAADLVMPERGPEITEVR